MAENATLPKETRRIWPGVSPALKLFAIAFLTLLMIVPLILIYGVIEERQGRRNEAVANVANAWGGTQRISGPFLIVPYTISERIESAGKVIESQATRYAMFLPESLEIGAKLRTSKRQRGIFAVPVYQSDLMIKGRFAPLDPRVAQSALSILWNEAELALGVQDIRAIKANTSLIWSGAAKELQPGISSFSGSTYAFSGVHARLGGLDPAAAQTFEISLTINGTESLSFTPLGKTTNIVMNADWPDPSFEGAYLPETRTITASGFDASWTIPHLARSLPQSVSAAAPTLEMADATQFGVRFYVPIDFYQLVSRALKYAILFVGTAFLVFFLAELLTRARVHVVQYLFIGAAQVIFYLLLLAFAEHWGFDQAYAMGAGATVILTGLYAATALRSWMRALMILIVMAVVYGLLYLLLAQEDFALLIGSVTLFAMLAVTMFLTRKIDWYEVNASGSGG